MAYVLVYMMDNFKYYVQNKDGEAMLNGLVNNAVNFQNEEIAKEMKQLYERELDRRLEIQEVFPDTQ